MKKEDAAVFVCENSCYDEDACIKHCRWRGGLSFKPEGKILDVLHQRSSLHWFSGVKCLCILKKNLKYSSIQFQKLLRRTVSSPRKKLQPENVFALRSSEIRMSLFLHQVWRNVSLHQCLSNGCEWVPSEWESDKNITIIHSTPVHQLTSGEDKTWDKSSIKTFITKIP